jgi:prophage tail gpP-like protein
MFENVTISGFPPIKAISISVSAEEAARTASLDLVIKGAGLPIVLGQEAVVRASGTLMFTGYVRDIGTGYSESDRELNCSLVSRTIDFIECSAEHATGEVFQKDIVGIAKELDTLGIGIKSDGTSFPKEARHKLDLGESPFHSIERRARGRGALIYDTPKGEIMIASKPAGIHAGTLRRGVNILVGASANFTEAYRYSDVNVRGQATEGTDKQQLRPQTSVRDSGIKRRRPLILVHEGETTIDRMKKRATWSARRAAGNSVTANIPVSGWRDEAQNIWQPNWLVQVEDDWLGIEGLMIIKSVEFEQGDMTKATLSLADPRALGGENPRGKSSGSYAAPGVNDAEYVDE